VLVLLVVALCRRDFADFVCAVVLLLNVMFCLHTDCIESMCVIDRAHARSTGRLHFLTWLSLSLNFGLSIYLSQKVKG